LNELNVRNATLAEVSSMLQGFLLDKPVVDQTGLNEKYDFILKFTPDVSQMAGFGGRLRPRERPILMHPRIYSPRSSSSWGSSWNPPRRPPTFWSLTR